MIHKYLSENDYNYLFNYIKYQANKYKYLPLDKDEIISAGLFGVVRGLKTFNKKYNTNIKTYLRYRINGEIKDTIRFITKSRNAFSRPEFVYNKKIIDSISVNYNYDETVFINEIKQVFSMFNDRDKYLLDMLYTKDFTMSDIANKLNITEPRVSQIHSKCIKQIKYIIYKEEHEKHL